MCHHSPPPIHFRHCRFVGGDNVAAAAAGDLDMPKVVVVVVVVVVALKQLGNPAPVRVWTQGRWKR